jgi:hypothetical protein
MITEERELATIALARRAGQQSAEPVSPAVQNVLAETDQQPTEGWWD